LEQLVLLHHVVLPETELEMFRLQVVKVNSVVPAGSSVA
jgi:hypothetical protein